MTEVIDQRVQGKFSDGRVCHENKSNLIIASVSSRSIEKRVDVK